MDQALDGIMASAENAMYKDKAMNHTAVNKGIIDTLIDELHAKSPRKMHSIFVRECAPTSELLCNYPDRNK